VLESLFLTLGLFLSGPGSTSGDNMETMQLAERALAEGHLCDRLQVTYSESNGLDGASILTLANGKVARDDRPRRGTGRRVEGPVSEEQCVALLKSALDGRLWEARSTDASGFPDEPRPRVEVVLDGRVLFLVEGWRHELKQNKGFVAVRDGLMGLVAAIPAPPVAK